MSRVAKKPINVPSGVTVDIKGGVITVKGKETLTHDIHPKVEVVQEDNVLSVVAREGSKAANALSGTTRALVNNMVVGVSEGFQRKLTMIGVGYRAQAQGKNLNLTVGYSHPVIYEAPEGVKLSAPSATEILVEGADKQKVGQVAAELRAIRAPDAYKGKGIRYADEHVKLKETKKK